MYTIQLDQTKNFECNLKIQGASLKKSKINMIIEGDDFDIKLKGTIDSTGQVTIPVKKLKGILDENVKGNMFLEVIADDTYFTPYKTEYLTEISRKYNKAGFLVLFPSIDHLSFCSISKQQQNSLEK